ncbi:MAG: hypothetical protein ACJAZS_000098 [Alteromonas naphthalenivorans]|jgi:hypothetical protein
MASMNKKNLLLLLTPVFLMASERVSPITRLVRFTIVSKYTDPFDCDLSRFNTFEKQVLKKYSEEDQMRSKAKNNYDCTLKELELLSEERLERHINLTAQEYFERAEQELKVKLKVEKQLVEPELK